MKRGLLSTHKLFLVYLFVEPFKYDQDKQHMCTRYHSIIIIIIIMTVLLYSIVIIVSKMSWIEFKKDFLAQVIMSAVIWR